MRDLSLWSYSGLLNLLEEVAAHAVEPVHARKELSKQMWHPPPGVDVLLIRDLLVADEALQTQVLKAIVEIREAKEREQA